MLRIANELDAFEIISISWFQESNKNEFNMDVDLKDFMKSIKDMIKSNGSDVIISEIDGKIIGLMGLVVFKSPLSSQKIANEHYWYILPEFRGHGKGFLKFAEKWASEKGCSHLMVNASYLASDLADKVSRLYEIMKFKKFENVFIKEVQL